MRALWARLTGSLWFVPTTAVILAIVLAIAMVEVDGMLNVDLGARWPRLFGAAPDGARGMLTAIAGSTITVAGVVFSVTIVALSLAASQYSPRVLRTFTSDRATQVVLGVFVSVFAYCLVVLRTIRDHEATSFVPAMAVLGGLILALVSIGFFVYFIHHLAESIQAAAILSRISAATVRAIDQLFPDELGDSPNESDGNIDVDESAASLIVPARKTGYICTVDGDGLIRFACDHDRIVRMGAAIGDFVIEGQPLVLLEGNARLSDREQKTLNAKFYFGVARTIQQDVSYGVQQIVDMGCKALSPGINDASTALLCIDRLSELLVRIARRRISTPLRYAEQKLRVVARGPTFESLVELSYRNLRNNSRGQVPVLIHLVASIAQVAMATANKSRRDVLVAELNQFAELASSLPEPAFERRRLDDCLNRVRAVLCGSVTSAS